MGLPNNLFHIYSIHRTREAGAHALRFLGN